jgi:hypothetical protein
VDVDVRQHVEIIDGNTYMATTLPRTGGSLPHRPAGWVN